MGIAISDRTCHGPPLVFPFTYLPICPPVADLCLLTTLCLPIQSALTLPTSACWLLSACRSSTWINPWHCPTFVVSLCTWVLPNTHVTGPISWQLTGQSQAGTLIGGRWLLTESESESESLSSYIYLSSYIVQRNCSSIQVHTQHMNSKKE